jgi:GT2 family glycosyltransferase
MDLSIIIVSWNTRELLAQCLESIYTYPPLGEFEVWVVDNASSHGSAAMVRERFPQVHLIENCENVGFARANNQAIRASTGRYVLLLNSDTIAQPNALARMVAFMGAHPEAGIVGAYILNPDGSPQYCFGKFPTLISESAFAWGLNTHSPFSARFAPRLGFRDDFVATDWVVGAALMVRREVLERVGLLDESYFMYSEEIDLAYRVKQAGWQIFVLGAARVVHVGQQSSKQMPGRMKAQLYHSKVLYFQKHHGQAAASLLRWVFGTNILIKCWVYRLTDRTLAALWSETWGYFVGKKNAPPSGQRSANG